MGEMPLEIRREQLMTNYWANSQGHNESHPTRDVLVECWEHSKCHRNGLGQTGNAMAKELGVINMKISPSVVYPVVAPWKQAWPKVD